MIQALPKLIKLNPIVVKEVFNRLLGTQHGRGRGRVTTAGWDGEAGISLGTAPVGTGDLAGVERATCCGGTVERPWAHNQRSPWGHRVGRGRSPRCHPVLCPPAGDGASTVSPLNPGELLIALHNIDSSKCDMKSIIKGGCGGAGAGAGRGVPVTSR